MTRGFWVTVFLILFLLYLVKWFKGLFLHNFLLKTDFSGMWRRYTRRNYRWQKKSSWLSGDSSRSQPNARFSPTCESAATMASSRRVNLVFSLFVVDFYFLVIKKRDNATWNHRKAIHKIKEQIRKTNLFFHLFNQLLLTACYVSGPGDMRSGDPVTCLKKELFVQFKDSWISLKKSSSNFHTSCRQCLEAWDSK